MKTTLKRGIGRGAAFNGKAVLPPRIAPPIRRYRQPPPPRRTFFGFLVRAVVWLFVAVLTTGAGVAGGAYLFLQEAVVEELSAHSPEVRLAAQELDIALPGQPAIALVIGYDFRAGPEGEEMGSRSDTLMVLRADPLTNSVSMLSFPRDLVTEIRCPGEPPRTARINAAYEECGTRGSLETVRALTGLPINYLVTLNFRGFTQLVGSLGGVWLDIDRRYFNDNSGGERYAAIDLQPGYQKLNGRQALDFVRYRHTDSDLFRIARQQLFVRAFRAQVVSAFSATAVPKIARIVAENAEVADATGELSLRTLWSYGLFVHQLPAGRFFQSRIDDLREHDNFDLSASRESIQAAINDFLNPDVEAGEKATVSALGLKPAATQAPPPAQTTLVVLNGNGVPGAAADTSWQFRERGYVTLDPPNGLDADAPSHDYYRSKVYYVPGREGAEAAARALEPLVGEADIEELPVDLHLRARVGQAMVVLVLGQRFSGTIAPAPVDRTPQRQDPLVSERPDLTTPLVREAQREVPFPLLVPTVLERTSTPSRQAPVRVYEIAGRKTVRLTFATGASDYWGIQMVRWGQAPALKDPTRKVTLKGRTYDLHYVGPRLQMVVLRESQASYWVVNTLRNALSNETMLAIAQGLKPLDE